MGYDAQRYQWDLINKVNLSGTLREGFENFVIFSDCLNEYSCRISEKTSKTSHVDFTEPEDFKNEAVKSQSSHLQLEPHTHQKTNNRSQRMARSWYPSHKWRLHIVGILNVPPFLI